MEPNPRGKIMVERWEIREFYFKIEDVIDNELVPVVADKVHGIIEPTMLEVKDMVEREVVKPLKELLKNAQFEDEDLRAKLEKILDDIPNLVIIYIILAARRASEHALKKTKKRINKEVRKTLKRLDAILDEK